MLRIEAMISLILFLMTMSLLFYRIGKESQEALSTSLLKNGDLIDEMETYDFKLRTDNGKLDIRVKFNHAGKPEVVAVKKAEYKLAIFDVLCLKRCVIIIVTIHVFTIQN